MTIDDRGEAAIAPDARGARDQESAASPPSSRPARANGCLRRVARDRRSPARASDPCDLGFDHRIGLSRRHSFGVSGRRCKSLEVFADLIDCFRMRRWERRLRMRGVGASGPAIVLRLLRLCGSGTFQPRGLSARRRTRPIGRAVRRDLPPVSRETVITAAALARLFDPSPGDPPAILELVEEGIERCDVEGELPAGLPGDLARDVVAVELAGFERGKNQNLRTCLFVGLVIDWVSRYMGIYIYHGGSSSGFKPLQWFQGFTARTYCEGGRGDGGSNALMHRRGGRRGIGVVSLRHFEMLTGARHSSSVVRSRRAPSIIQS